MPGPPESGRNPYEHPVGDGRNQIQRSLATNLKKVPGIESVRYENSQVGVEHQLVGDIDTSIFAEGIITAETATVQINWWPLHDDEDRNWYQFHYYESDGFDCGWHRHDNNHVDGLDHYQERQSPDDEYEYYTFQPHFSNPVGLLWEIVDDRLVSRLKMRYESE